MNIKTWGDRLEGLDDGHLTTNSDIRVAMQAEIDELRAALKAQPVQEPTLKVEATMLHWLKDRPPAGTLLYAAPGAQPVQPAPLTMGWKLVPTEPTMAQVKAAVDAWLYCDSELVLNKATAALRAGILASTNPVKTGGAG